jgi:membrane-associated HD superfamily phosphohydrolase
VYSGEFFEDLEIALDSCSNNQMGTIGHAKYTILSIVTTTIFASLITLTFSSFYYLFGPSQHHILNKSQIFKMRVLVFCMFASTISAVVGSLFMYGHLLAFYSFQPGPDFCDDQARIYWAPGSALMLAAVVLAFYLLW